MSPRTLKINIIFRIDLFSGSLFNEDEAKSAKRSLEEENHPLHFTITMKQLKKSTRKLYGHHRADFGLRISITIKNVRGALKNKPQTYLYRSLLLFQGTKVESPLSNQEPDIPVVLFSCSTSAGKVHQGAQSSIHSRKRAKIRVRLHD